MYRQSNYVIMFTIFLFSDTVSCVIYYDRGYCFQTDVYVTSTFSQITIIFNMYSAPSNWRCEYYRTFVFDRPAICNWFTLLFDWTSFLRLRTSIMELRFSMSFISLKISHYSCLFFSFP